MDDTTDLDMSDAAERVVAGAAAAAAGRRGALSPEDLLGALCAEERFRDAVASAGGDFPALLAACPPAPPTSDAPASHVRVARTAAAVLAAAARAGGGTVDLPELTEALAEAGGRRTRRMLAAAGAPPAAIAEALHGAPAPASPAGTAARGEARPSRRRRTDQMPPMLTDLSAAAAGGAFDDLVERPGLSDAALRILGRARKPNIMLTGPAGSGKTAVVECIARALSRGQAPPALAGRRIVALDSGALVAGTTLRGEFEARMRTLIEWWRAHPEAVVFADEAHLLLGAGTSTESRMDASNLLKPLLARERLSMIAATTDDEYRTAMRGDAAWTRRFSRLRVPAATAEEAAAMCAAAATTLSTHHGVTVDGACTAHAVAAAIAAWPGAALPDPALDLLDDACALAGAAGRTALTCDDIDAAAAATTGTRTSGVNPTSLARLAGLAPALSATVLGQPAAVAAAVAAVARAELGLRRADRPRAVLLFAGPSGVGKTLLASELARATVAPDALLRIDCGEFTAGHHLARLVGAPPGYVGHHSGGQLTEALRTTPRTVLLFDEVEKAAADLHDLLLGLLDSGRITDAAGGTVDARHATVILTSNLGAGRTAGFAPDLAAARAAAVAAGFRPEFANRLDAVITFTDLSSDALVAVAAARLDDAAAMFAAQGVELRIGPGAAEAVAAEAGAGGARAVARTVDARIIDPGAAALLDPAGPPRALDVRPGAAGIQVTPR